MDGAVPWGSDPLSEELSGLAKDAGALWTGSDYPTLLAGGAGAPHATRNWDIAIKNGPTLGRMGPFRKLPLDDPGDTVACRFSICQSDGYRDIASVRQMVNTRPGAPLWLAGRQPSFTDILLALCPRLATVDKGQGRPLVSPA
ncbi:hypothetical protein D3C72_1801730 [compost metagenome]